MSVDDGVGGAAGGGRDGGGEVRDTVLVADDSMVVRAVVRETLEAQGYRVLEATDGDAALRSCQEGAPDVVVLSLEMPRRSGFEVLAALKHDPALADLPVVFLTGREGVRDVVRALELGAHDYLRKPFEGPELIARVGAAARVKRLQDELRRRNQELDRMSRIDALTGLANRRHLEERLIEFSANARRHAIPMGLAIVDVDHFKAVNDTYGHPVGDAVLVEVARRLATVVREGDVVGRWGGEEFLVIAPHSPAGGVARLGERLRAAVAESPVTYEVDAPPVPVTISVGCAFTLDEPSPVVLERADRALYEAKRTGRDRVIMG